MKRNIYTSWPNHVIKARVDNYTSDYASDGLMRKTRRHQVAENVGQQIIRFELLVRLHIFAGVII